MTNTKQYEYGFKAYCKNEGYENPYTNPEWAREWDRGYYEAKALNEGY